MGERGRLLSFRIARRARRDFLPSARQSLSPSLSLTTHPRRPGQPAGAVTGAQSQGVATLVERVHPIRRLLVALLLLFLEPLSRRADQRFILNCFLFVSRPHFTRPVPSISSCARQCDARIRPSPSQRRQNFINTSLPPKGPPLPVRGKDAAVACPSRSLSSSKS